MTLRPGLTTEVLNHRGIGFLPELIGFRVMALEQGMLVAEMEVRQALLAPNGFLHAATVVALADTSCGYGCIAHLPRGAENFTTVELKINFLGTAREGTLTCIAKPAHLGNTTQVWDATVSRHADGKAIALFRCTQMILWPRAGKQT
jgi:1,4-dihydroxy-2-naphthoyl-CoA hydrolase